MDPIAHTFTGAALAAAGLRRTTPLATAALILAANAPDVDGLMYFAGSFEALDFRRGWTHGVLALVLWPFVLTGLLLLWDRWFRRRGRSAAPPARAGPLLGLAALGVATHPTLDWLNNYGLRWLMPFDGTWFYGDALFIIDPWLWLVLGGALFLMYSRRSLALVAWAVFWLAASTVVFTTAQLVPSPARVLWIAGLVGLFAARALGFAAPKREARIEIVTRVALGVVVVYVAVVAVADGAARALVRTELAARNIGIIEEVMVAPVPANPLGGDVVAATSGNYYTGRWRWLQRPHLELDAERIERPQQDSVYEAASRTRDAQLFLGWARFPYVEVRTNATGERSVSFLDARYRTSVGIVGPTVRLDRDLQPLVAP